MDLFRMCWRDLFDRLEFCDDFIFNNQVCSDSFVKMNALIIEGNWNLSRYL
jgi:hypothetical protein